MRKFLLSFCLLITVLSTFAQTFSATVNQTIPDDGSTVTFDIIVNGLPSTIDTFFGLEQVCLNMTHTWDSDMEVKIQAPDGTTSTLFSGVGGADDDFTNTCLSGSGIPIATGTAPFTGTFQSMGVIGNINNGQNPNGIWKLVVHDTYAFADQGFMIDWNITFGANPAHPFLFASSNLPIVKLTTIGTAISNDPKVPVMMQIIDNGPGVRNYTNQTNYAYEGRIMTEWQGFSGPGYPKKNYDFELVDSLGVEIDASILGMSVEHDWIFKAEYLDHTLIKNMLSYDMARKMGNYAPNTRPCEIILDGEYIGYYTLTEKVKRDANRVNIAKMDSTDTTGINLTGGYIIEMNINGDPADWTSNYAASNSTTACCPVEYKHVYPKSNVILPVQHDYIRAYTDTFENVLASNYYANPDTGYRKYIDENAFIDFLIVNEFSVNYDSYGRSTYLYKNKGGKLKCGPSWDYDRAFEYTNPGLTTGWVWQITHQYWPFPFHWERMWEDSIYRKQLACRWFSLRQNILHTDSFMAYIDTMAAKLDEAQGRNFTAWNDLGGQTYYDQIDSLKSFLNRRLDWIDMTLAQENVSLPLVYLPTDTALCQSAVFDASYNGTQYTYNWQPGPDTSIITLLQSGTYNLQVTGDFGCYTKKSMDVTFAQPTISFNSQQVGGNPLIWYFIPSVTVGNTFSWSFGDGTFSTSISPTHTYATNGTYIVSLTTTSAGGCTASYQYTLIISGVSINEANVFEGQIYPNPFEDKIEIAFTTPTQTSFSLHLINQLGQNILTQSYPAATQRLSLSTAPIAAGVYVLQIVVGDRIWMNKVVKL